MNTINMNWVPLTTTVFADSVELLVRELEMEGRTRYSQTAATKKTTSKFSGVTELLRNANTKCLVLLAHRQEIPIGIAICQTAISTWDVAEVLNIHDLFVSKEHRGKGVGAALVEEIESKGRELQMSQVTLETNIGNIRARRLYLDLGYQGTLLTPEGQCPIQSHFNDSMNLAVIRMKKNLT